MKVHQFIIVRSALVIIIIIIWVYVVKLDFLRLSDTIVIYYNTLVALSLPIQGRLKSPNTKMLSWMSLNVLTVDSDSIKALYLLRLSSGGK